MASVKIVYRRDKLNKNNEAPIHFRIIKDRKPRYITSSLMIPEEYWDEKNKQVKGKYKGSGRINAFITSKYSELLSEVANQETSTKGLTSRQLRDRVLGKRPTDFFVFAENANKLYLREGKVGTYDKNASIIKKLKEYVKGTLSFQDITPEFLMKYEKYLSEELGNKINTIHRDFKFIRKVFNDAYKQDLIEHHLIPFNKLKLKTEKTHREFLTEEELKKIEKLKLTPGTRLALHRDMFLFASYTGGIRVSDVLLLRWKNFDGERIYVSIKKTKGQIAIKIPDKALSILRKLRPRKANQESFIFPQLDSQLNVENVRELDTAISRATAYINKNLKIIRDKVELTKNLSFHISRHTFATRALTKGISLDKVSKLMGHANVRETQVYAKIVSEGLDKAMDVFNS